MADLTLPDDLTRERWELRDIDNPLGMWALSDRVGGTLRHPATTEGLAALIKQARYATWYARTHDPVTNERREGWPIHE
jgi:hypothetical protein